MYISEPTLHHKLYIWISNIKLSRCYPQYVHHHGRKEAFVVVAVVKLNSTFVTREAQIWVFSLSEDEAYSFRIIATSVRGYFISVKASLFFLCNENLFFLFLGICISFFGFLLIKKLLLLFFLWSSVRYFTTESHCNKSKSQNLKCDARTVFLSTCVTQTPTVAVNI